MVISKSERSGQETELEESIDLAPQLGAASAFFTVTAATGDFTATHLITHIAVQGGGLPPRALGG